MPYPMDVQNFARLREDYPVISDAQSTLTGELSLQFLTSPRPVLPNSTNCSKIRIAVCRSRRRMSPRASGDHSIVGVPHFVLQRKIIRGQAEVGEDV